MPRHSSHLLLLCCAAALAACASTATPPGEAERPRTTRAEALEVTGGVIRSILSFLNVGVVIR